MSESDSLLSARNAQIRLSYCPCADCGNGAPARNPTNPNMTDEYVMDLHRDYARFISSHPDRVRRDWSPEEYAQKFARWRRRHC